MSTVTEESIKALLLADCKNWDKREILTYALYT